MSLCIDASAALALHFEDEFRPFEPLEARLAAGEEAYTAPNFFQEVMEALRRAIREGRTTKADANAWLTVLDSLVHPWLNCFFRDKNNFANSSP